jgi:hypothetical protein
MIENRELRKIFGPNVDEISCEFRVLRDEELLDLQSHLVLLESRDSSGGIATRIRAGRSGF